MRLKLSFSIVVIMFAFLSCSNSNENALQNNDVSEVEGYLNCKKCSCSSFSSGSNGNCSKCGHSFYDHRRAGELISCLTHTDE